MKRKKLRNRILVVAVIIAFVVSNMFIWKDSAAKVNAADNSGASITMTCSQEKVGLGDTITISVNLSITGNVKCNGIYVYVRYSAEALELVSLQRGDLTEEKFQRMTDLPGYNSENGKYENILGWNFDTLFFDNEAPLIDKGGTLFTATFSVKSLKGSNLYELPGVYLEILSARARYDGSGLDSNTFDYKEDDYNRIRLECTQHNIITEEVDATCESAGTSKRVCIECGTIMENIIIPAYGHDYGDWIVAREPNVGVAGELYRTCSLCNKTETRLIPPLEPDTEEPSTKAPPTEEPSTEAPPTEEPSTETPPTEEPTTEDAPIATPTDVNNITSPKTGDGAMPMGAAVLGIFSLVGAFALKRKHKSL